MREIVGPGAHHGSTPIKDPRVPGVSAGGDGAEPLATRPHREIVFAAMALVVVFAALAAWWLFKPSPSDSEARASAAEMGLHVADDVEVAAIDGGYRLFWEFTPDIPTDFGGFYFDVVQADSVSPPADLSTWEPKIDGATAYAEGEPPLQVVIDAGERYWIVTSGTATIYQEDTMARAAWYALAGGIRFTSE